MAPKRKFPLSQTDSNPSKRPRPSLDIISTLSDELLVRILSSLSPTALLAVAPVSHRFLRIVADSQLWRAHYYARFVLPRALRIPGFTKGAAAQSRLHYSARRAVWADGGWGRRGGLVDVRERQEEKEEAVWKSVDWKRQYKLRHNWARGKCAVEEVSVREAIGGDGGRRTLVKVVEGIAVTADSASGLRAWDLRTKRPIAQIALQDEPDEDVHPTCLAVDEQGLKADMVDVMVGFGNGSFGIWRLDVGKQELRKRYQHEKSSNGELEAVAYGHPYALTATSAGLISLYIFNELPPEEDDITNEDEIEEPPKPGKASRNTELSAPYLLTSLKSHTSRPPLALSIRKMTASVNASIAYTFDSRDGWCIGIQNINIQPSPTTGRDVLSSRLAYTLPIKSPDSETNDFGAGPTTLCYSHPYLLATLPDNTLILHLCTSTSTSLSLSPGIRLWGHTSGISDAEITPRGKAVSVSARGNEIRVWELEGRAGGSSIEVRPRQPTDDADVAGETDKLGRTEWEDKRNWVGFDDEMVIVLKEARDGRESLVVYDFT